jgi:hypothetical protein
MTRAVWIAALVACRAPQQAPMFPAGSDKDDGYGDLAQKSARLLIGDGDDAALFPPRHRRARAGSAYGGDPYGGALYGGDAYGGAPIAPGPPPPVLQRYTPTTGLTGTIEGTVTWRGALPRPLSTACGAFENPSVRVAANRAVAGVLVYIEHVEVGRTLPTIGDRPVTVGGIVTKRGCALGPPLQILTPLPADLAIHGDATVTTPALSGQPWPPGPPSVRAFELQPAGRVLVPAQPGVMRIEAADDSLAPAWVVAASTPYYAITDDRGRFRIDELATGTYDVTFWQAPLATAANGKVVYGAPVIVHRTIRVDPGKPSRVDVALP